MLHQRSDTQPARTACTPTRLYITRPLRMGRRPLDRRDAKRRNRLSDATTMEFQTQFVRRNRRAVALADMTITTKRTERDIHLKGRMMTDDDLTSMSTASRPIANIALHTITMRT